MSQSLQFATHIVWEGNRGRGTADYASYARDYRIRVDGKPDLLGSAAPRFRGDTQRHDPEDLLVAAVSACHMLAYLALCARRGIQVVAYEDHAEGDLALDAAGGGGFSAIRLRPHVTVAVAAHRHEALQLHRTAHAQCFIANSCHVPITLDATIDVAAGESQ